MSDVKAIADILKDFATVVALIGGGAWTVYTFSALGTRARAQAEQFKQAVLDVSIDAKVESKGLQGEGSFIASAIASVVNKGTRNTFLDFRNAKAFTVSRVAFAEDGEGNAVPLMEIDCNCEYMTLRVGARGQFPVYFKVSGPGLYEIRFAVDLSEEEVHVHRISAKDKAPRIVWSGSTHIFIE